MTIINSIIQNFQLGLQYVLSLSRFSKRVIVLIVDTSLCILTVWFAFYLRLGEFVSFTGNNFWAVILSIITLLPIFLFFGLYRVIFRYSSWQSMYMILLAMSVYALLYASIITFIGISGVPRTIGIIQPLLLSFLIIAFRILAQFLLDSIFLGKRRKEFIPKALIYGAGSAGRQLVSGFENSNDIKVVGFLDDDNNLQGNLLYSKLIYSPDDLPSIVKSKGVSHILLAIPSASRRRKNEILTKIGKYNVAVRMLPSVTDLADGRVTISDLRNPDIEDLLGRDSVKPNYKLLTKKITGKVVLVTGSGGSIGSELCRQIIKLEPSKLILLEMSEYGLYTIHEELENIMQITSFGNKNFELVPILASVQDENHIRKIMHKWQPDTVYHAAAYKHVPLVERNLVEGIKNNVIGTLVAAKVAIEEGVSDFLLISTDKAVRPTNVMGASKRLAELCLQSLSSKQSQELIKQSLVKNPNVKLTTTHDTTFSIVRFGNVLDSSGSVIPRFRKQIRDGGPITLTHPEITRYFMTIPEAAQLVIQATSMAKGGDIFLLDMGEPIKIADLARRMVELSGLSVRNELCPDGDIEIVITGLRPGEKLYEELSLGGHTQQTMNKKIKRAKDPYIPWKDLELEIENLRNLLAQNKVEMILAFLQKFVTGYKPSKNILDFKYHE